MEYCRDRPSTMVEIGATALSALTVALAARPEL